MKKLMERNVVDLINKRKQSIEAKLYSEGSYPSLIKLEWAIQEILVVMAELAYAVEDLKQRKEKL
jgi:hypothetical protein